jgi:UDP-N-acetylglucosamine 4,6-dehydratase
LFIASNVYSGELETKISVVRYGNVAGSRGSVIPFFKKLIADGVKEIPITDFRMTRFWLKLEEAVEMVIEAIETMNGGELFVRKIPSMKITDLAQAMAPNLKLKEVGIRPGEKIHEVMISTEDSRSTIELEKYYIIKPESEELRDRVLIKGKPVDINFEYNSGNNSKWLTIPQMKDLIKEVDEEI